MDAATKDMFLKAVDQVISRIGMVMDLDTITVEVIRLTARSLVAYSSPVAPHFNPIYILSIVSIIINLLISAMLLFALKTSKTSSGSGDVKDKSCVKIRDARRESKRAAKERMEMKAMKTGIIYHVQKSFISYFIINKHYLYSYGLI